MSAERYVAAGMLLGAAGLVGLSLGRYRDAQQRWHQRQALRAELTERARAATEWRRRGPQVEPSTHKASNVLAPVQPDGSRLERWAKAHLTLTTVALFLIATGLGLVIAELIIRFGSGNTLTGL
jgi:hypothetical protein